MKQNILVIGGTGKTGRRVVERLNNLNQHVRVGSRSANPAFDWEDPQTWSAVLEGMDMVYITFQPDLAVPGALEAIEGLTREAKAKGIKKLVLLSGKGEREAQLCEQVVAHSGIDYTIVRASWFMQNFSESFLLDPILAGHVALPKAEAMVPYVHADDIADVVVAALMSDEHNGQTYELTGPDRFTFEEVIEEISLATGKEIQFTPISLSAYTDMLQGFGLSKDYIWLINYLFSEVLDAEGNNVIIHDVEKVLGRKPRTLRDYVSECISAGVWEQRLSEAG